MPSSSLQICVLFENYMENYKKSTRFISWKALIKQNNDVE